MFPVFTSDRFGVPLPPQHRFPIRKYGLLRRALLDEGVLREAQLREPEAAGFETLCLAHASGYVRAVLDGTLDGAGLRRLGFPWSRELVERARRSVGGTLAAAAAALDSGVAGNLAGGTHHAHAGCGSGFCTFNDVAVAVRALRGTGRFRRALVVDLDVHQGDGTARIFAEDPDTFTFSVHGAHNFPFRKAASDLDVPLPDGTDDGGYLAALERCLPQAWERARPEIVFYLAGSDPHERDRLGRMRLTHAGLQQRDARVIGLCLTEKVPLVLTLAGGYAEPIEHSVRAHLNTYRALNDALGRLNA